MKLCGSLILLVQIIHHPSCKIRRPSVCPTRKYAQVYLTIPQSILADLQYIHSDKIEFAIQNQKPDFTKVEVIWTLGKDMAEKLFKFIKLNQKREYIKERREFNPKIKERMFINRERSGVVSSECR